MNRNMIRMIPLLIMLAVSIAISSGMFHDSNKLFQDAPLVGFDIVPFNVHTLGSDQPRFAPRDWHDKIIVLNVFASWCEPCQAEHKVWMNLAKTGKATIYGLAWKDTPEKVSAWLNKNGNPYHLIGIDQHGDTTIPLALTGIPETVILGPTGTIYFHHQEAVTQELVDNVIIPIIEKIKSGELKPPKRIPDEDPISLAPQTPVNPNADMSAPAKANEAAPVNVPAKTAPAGDPSVAPQPAPSPANAQ
jgi:cytochrome c biogenesis protein CcmG/thiol:disulfide interchange protein DsbE